MTFVNKLFPRNGHAMLFAGWNGRQDQINFYFQWLVKKAKKTAPYVRLLSDLRDQANLFARCGWQSAQHVVSLLVAWSVVWTQLVTWTSSAVKNEVLNVHDHVTARQPIVNGTDGHVGVYQSPFMDFWWIVKWLVCCRPCQRPVIAVTPLGSGPSPSAATESTRAASGMFTGRRRNQQRLADGDGIFADCHPQTITVRRFAAYETAHLPQFALLAAVLAVQRPPASSQAEPSRQHREDWTVHPAESVSPQGSHRTGQFASSWLVDVDRWVTDSRMFLKQVPKQVPVVLR